MKIKKTALSIALGAALGLSTTASQGGIINMDYSGLFTMLDSGGTALQNTSYPYYGDPTWGYGLRTQISGTMQFDTITRAGSGTVTPFEFFNGGPAVAFQAIGDGKGGPGSLILGNMTFGWGGNTISTQIVLDAAGFFAEVATIAIGDIYDATTCASSGACATPAYSGPT